MRNIGQKRLFLSRFHKSYFLHLSTPRCLNLNQDSFIPIRLGWQCSWLSTYIQSARTKQYWSQYSLKHLHTWNISEHWSNLRLNQLNVQWQYVKFLKIFVSSLVHRALITIASYNASNLSLAIHEHTINPVETHSYPDKSLQWHFLTLNSQTMLCIRELQFRFITTLPAFQVVTKFMSALV